MKIRRRKRQLKKKAYTVFTTQPDTGTYRRKVKRFILVRACCGVGMPLNQIKV